MTSPKRTILPACRPKKLPPKQEQMDASAPEHADQNLSAKPQPGHADDDHGARRSDEHEEGVQEHHCPSPRRAATRRSSLAFRFVGAEASPALSSAPPSPPVSG